MCRRARAAWYGPPPGRGASPGRKSRARLPSSAINRAEYGVCERREAEGGGEARQRGASPRERVRVRVGDEPRPPGGAHRREPLVEAEAGDPCEHELRPHVRRGEDRGPVVVTTGQEPVGEEHAEERDEERPE